MNLQYYLLKLKPGTCPGRPNVFSVFRYKSCKSVMIMLNTASAHVYVYSHMDYVYCSFKVKKKEILLFPSKLILLWARFGLSFFKNLPTHNL